MNFKLNEDIVSLVSSIEKKIGKLETEIIIDLRISNALLETLK